MYIVTLTYCKLQELQGEYEKELDAIEEAYTEERDRIIGEHTGEIDGMFEHRRNKEVHYKEAKQKSEEQYQREVSTFLIKKLKTSFQMSQYRTHLVVG